MSLLHSDSTTWYCANWDFSLKRYLITLQFQYEEKLTKNRHFNSDKLKQN